MSTSYPGTIQTFTDPAGTSLVTSPDHAGLHTDVNDTLEAIQTTLGTTGGTSVLRNFVAGNFPARINSSNVLQQAVSGTVNNSVLGTPAITGGTATNSVLVTPTIGTPVVNVGSDATGDMYYRNAGALARLAIGAASTFLTTNGTSPSWGTLPATGNFKSGSFTRLRDAGSGTVGITGVGFTPKAVVFLSAVNNTQGWSVGVDSGTIPFCLAFPTTGTVINTRNSASIHSRDNSSWEVSGSINTFTADGFVIGWTFGGAPPAGTIDVYYLTMG